MVLNIMKQLRTRREGSTLAFTLVLLTLFLVVGAAVLTASMSAVTTSQLTGARQQAYYTARSAVSVTVKQIESDGTFVAGLGLSQSNRSVTGTAKGNDVSEQAMLAGGNCTVKVEATAFDSNGSPSAIKVTATATKGGATASAARVLTAGKSAAPDFSYTFYSTSNLSLGDISVVNDASIAGNSGKSICCGGDVSIINDLKWRELNTYGDIYTAGSFYMDTYYQNNNLFGSVYAQKNAGASLGCYIYGNLTYGGLLSYWLNYSPQYIVTGSVKPSSQSISCTTPATPTLPQALKNFPSASQKITLSQAQGNIGYITSTAAGLYGDLDNISQKKNEYYVDTSAGNVYLRAAHTINGFSSRFYLSGSHDVYLFITGDSTVFSPNNFGVYLQPDMTGNLYIYIDGKATFDYHGTSSVACITPMEGNTTSGVYVAGTGAGTLSLSGWAGIAGYINMPQGNFYADDGNILYSEMYRYVYSVTGSTYAATCKVAGSVIAKNISCLPSNNTVLYFEHIPMPSGLAKALGNNSSATPGASGSGGWSEGKWSGS
jgi:hypothetical protein